MYLFVLFVVSIHTGLSERGGKKKKEFFFFKENEKKSQRVQKEMSK